MGKRTRNISTCFNQWWHKEGRIPIKSLSGRGAIDLVRYGFIRGWEQRALEDKAAEKRSNERAQKESE